MSRACSCHRCASIRNERDGPRLGVLMRIYEFQNGANKWADFRVPEGAKVLRHIDINSPEDAKKHLKRETGRIAALIERALTELPQQPKKRNVWERLKYLFEGD